MAYSLFLLNRPVAAPSGNRSAPSSSEPSSKAIANYRVAPSLPRYIEIPSINVGRTRVIRLGVTKKKQIASPGNIYDAGWYDKSSKPGQDGAMFIYGHVSSWTADGVFYNLKSLRPGDKVIITRGDNKKFTYRVVFSKIYPADKIDMHAALSPAQAGKPGLNLMTCAGHVIKNTNNLSERLVVFTSQIGG